MKPPATFLLLASLLLASCGKEERATPVPAPVVAAKKPETAKPPPAKKEPIVAPQGKLPVMDPDKAKFIAVPSTPKDAEVKKAEAKKPETPKDEVKKPADPQAEIKKAEPPPEVKKAEAASQGAARE